MQVEGKPQSTPLPSHSQPDPAGTGTSSSPRTEIPRAGTSPVFLDRYRLVEELGRGATAKVYLAADDGSGELFSIKVFHADRLALANLSPRIQREIALSATLKHPHIVRLHRVLDTQDPPALVMEYIDGENLGAFQARLPYVLPEVSVLVVLQILEALEYAHGAGVIHRDLKPENVLIDRQGRVVVTDFGLAKWEECTALTRSNILLGSLEYMSPEQAKGDTLGTGTDLFSVGSILYFLTTGTRPFSRGSPLATLAAIRDEAPEPPHRRNPKISPALSRLLLKSLAKDQAKRFANAGEFRQSLETYLIEIGLEPGLFNLGLWMRDPTVTTVEGLKIVAERLALKGDGAVKRGDWDGLLETLAHLSLKAPESPALARLTQLYRRKRQRRKWLGAGLLLLLSAGLGGTAALLPRAMRNRTLPVPPPKLPAVTLAAPATLPIPLSLPSAPERPVAPRPRPTGTVTFELPDEVTVYWDGELVDPDEPLPDQSVGPHELKLLRPGFDPIHAQVEVKAGEPTIIRVN